MDLKQQWNYSEWGNSMRQGASRELKGLCGDGSLLSRDLGRKEIEQRIQADGMGWIFSDVQSLTRAASLFPL